MNALLKPTPLIVRELSDRTEAGVDVKILDALRFNQDRFFRTGYPLTETLLLISLKVLDFEQLISQALSHGRFIIEDRSVDTIAVYQAAILCPQDIDQQLVTANDIYEVAINWRPPPDTTFLFHDDFDTAVRRAQDRMGQVFSRDELLLLRRAHELYLHWARHHPSRINVLDRRTLSEDDILAALHRALTHASRLRP
jgi:dTMP kinase